MRRNTHLKNTPPLRMGNSKYNKGFTLIEALVTVIVMSIGLLGIAALQNTSVKLTYDSYLRSQGALLASDLFDRMRANPAIDYSNLNYSSSNSSVSCSEVNDVCSAQQMATYDAATWVGRVEEIFGANDGDVSIAVNDRTSDGIDFDIVLTWSPRLSDPENPNSDTNLNQEFTYSARVKNVPLP